MQAVRPSSSFTSAITLRTARRLADRLAAHWRELLHRIAEHRRRAAARGEFLALDDAALRDLGVARGEFDSCWTESRGGSAVTRRRIADTVRPGQRP
jgi:uncharacterized protein YjiS (DUF1127 family)